jgi:hypothetical protein
MRGSPVNAKPRISRIHLTGRGFSRSWPRDADSRESGHGTRIPRIWPGDGAFLANLASGRGSPAPPPQELPTRRSRTPSHPPSRGSELVSRRDQYHCHSARNTDHCGFQFVAESAIRRIHQNPRPVPDSRESTGEVLTAIRTLAARGGSSSKRFSVSDKTVGVRGSRQPSYIAVACQGRCWAEQPTRLRLRYSGRAPGCRARRRRLKRTDLPRFPRYRGAAGKSRPNSGLASRWASRSHTSRPVRDAAEIRVP